MIRQMCRRLYHAPGVARGADTPAFAGIGDEVVVPAIVTPCAGKAMGKDAAFQIFAKGLADIGLWGVVVALAVELTGTGQLKPGFEMFGYGLVQQRAFGVARVVEFRFGTRWAVRMRMRLRWVPGCAVAGMGQCQRGLGV